MKSIKLLFILSLVCCFYQCSSSIFVSNPPFSVEKAFYNDWVGGQPGVRGMLLEVHLKNAAGIVFDSLYFQSKSTEVSVRNLDAKIQLIGQYTIANRIRRDVILNKDSSKELKNPFPSLRQFPFDLMNNEAVLSYKKEGKMLYFKVKNIRKVSTVPFPSAPKGN
ncbi:hypothetical protein PI23P_03077 [Polaribacter irgensii 23-P]|uniref:Lipoprotein n=1 Tax=Polaribacter irgensii 23-P TaxID=313594 RepID=A4BWV2_9FLAO|nr:hypothetical protein [Polaribacter irgensii]EAR13443.1 hypothetical protein PI23P_03077 [Polaribacter irgensii 23-P]